MTGGGFRATTGGGRRATAGGGAATPKWKKREDSAPIKYAAHMRVAANNSHAVPTARVADAE